MENKIIRLVIVRNNENKILGYVALRSNGVEKYGFKESVENKKKYRLQLTKELMKTYPDGLEDLIEAKDFEGVVNQLTDEGYILEAKEDIITKITINEEVEKSYFVVEYAVKEPETYDSNDFENIEDYDNMIEACKENIIASYGLSSDDDYDNLIKYNVGKPKKNIDILKIKNFKYTKKILAILTAGAILVGTYSCGKKNSEQENNISVSPTISMDTPTPAPTIEPIVTSTIAPTLTIKPTIVSTSIPVVAPGKQPIPYDVALQSKELFVIINSNGLEEGVYTTDDIKDIENLNLEYFYETISSNLGDLSYFASNGIRPLDHYNELTCAPRKIHFEKIIPGLTPIELGYIKYFSDLNIDIINSGFCLNNSVEAKTKNNYVIKEMIRCIKDNEPLQYEVNNNTVAVSFSDLSYEAQNAIMNICWGNYCLLGTDVVEYNGIYYNQALIGLDIYGLSQEPTSKR